MTAIIPRVVVVTRDSEYELLLARHATRGQAEFFLRERGQSIDAVEQRHKRFEAAAADQAAQSPGFGVCRHCWSAAWHRLCQSTAHRTSTDGTRRDLLLDRGNQASPQAPPGIIGQDT